MYGTPLLINWEQKPWFLKMDCISWSPFGITNNPIGHRGTFAEGQVADSQLLTEVFFGVCRTKSEFSIKSFVVLRFLSITCYHYFFN